MDLISQIDAELQEGNVTQEQVIKMIQAGTRYLECLTKFGMDSEDHEVSELEAHMSCLRSILKAKKASAGASNREYDM